jgi:3-phenylpropionate/trans-cinnamate dioxygenase ferredoxin subunit
MAELIKVANKQDVAPGSSVGVEVHGKQVVVFNVDGTFYALGGRCTHRGGPLSEGELEGTTVTCPWHGAQFDLKTGSALTPPAPEGVPSYKVVIEGDDVSIEV